MPAAAVWLVLMFAGVAQATPGTLPLLGSFGSYGSGPAQFSVPRGVAVDASGDALRGSVYVADQNNNRVERFGPTGSFEAALGSEQLFDPRGVAVDPSSGDVYVQDNENRRVRKYTPDGRLLSTVGESFHGGEFGSILAVDGAGELYVGDESAVRRFDPAGAEQSRVELPGVGRITALALDSSDRLYVKGEAAAGVREYDSSGALLRGFDEGSESVRAVAVGAEGDVYVVDGGLVLRYEASGALAASSQAGSIERSSGIAVNASGTVYVPDFAPFGGEVARVLLFGSPPTERLPPPTIAAEYAAQVHAADAILGVRIVPQFAPTTYYVQYGSDVSYSLGSVPAAPGNPLAGAADLQEHAGSVVLEGLQPGTTYHYRFVAVSPAGTTYGEDHTFVTYVPAAPVLADGRAYELVSPVGKESAELAVPGGAGGVAEAIPLQASRDGEAITYGSFTAFDSPQSAPSASQYLSTRGASGWSTQNVTPPDEDAAVKDPLRGFSEDLQHAAVVQSDPLLAAGAAPGVQNLYLRDTPTGSFTALTTATPRVAAGGSYCVAYAGASEDSSHVIFSATGALTEDAPLGAGNNLYEWSAGQLRLVSKLSDGTPASPSTATGFGAEGFGCAMNLSIVRHAISSDGRRIFWTYRPPSGVSQLLMREDAAKTVQLDKPQGGPDLAGDGLFWAASVDGSRALFSDDHALTVDASPGSQDLYEYDVASGNLTDLTPEPAGQAVRVLGVAGASEDLSYVYFVAEGVLASGASALQPNLYLRHGGTTTFIATLAGADSSDWSGQPRFQTARVTPDGQHLAFLSSARLTGYDNTDQFTGQPDAEAYVYDAASQSLACASCNPSRARPLGPASLPGWHTPYQQPRYISDDGSRVFFQSFDALALHDGNGGQDVYEWERAGASGCGGGAAGGGCLYLLSGGLSGDASFFLDASGDGRDAFISTRQQLVSQDSDERFDVYDVRAGGGFPAAQPAPASCAGEACRAPSPSADLLTPPVSAAFRGAGNPRAKHHPRHRKASHKRRRARRRRSAHRRRGAHGRKTTKHRRRLLAHSASAEGQAGIASFSIAATGPGGEPARQAGSHPDSLTVSFALNTVPGAEGQPVTAGGDVKDIRVSLPPGLLGNPLAVPRCAPQQFAPQPGTALHPSNACPDASAVGVIEAHLENSRYTVPIYDLIPPAGMPAQLGFQIQSVPFYIDTHVRSGGDYGIDAYMPNVSEAQSIAAANIVLWGVPAAHSHDAQRGSCLTGSPGPCPAGVAETPFLTLPTSCGVAPAAGMAFDGWRAPGVWREAAATLPPVTGCAALDFKPSVSAQPTGAVADGPTGLRVKLSAPQSQEPGGLAEAQLRDTVLALPTGLSVNPAVAQGLEGCSEAQVGFQGSDAQSGAALFADTPAACPGASQVGSVKISTPLLPAPLTGAVYLAQQGDAGTAHGSNPFGSLFALYVVAEGSGVRVKLAGEVRSDPLTGQLAVAFRSTPQLPFSELQLELEGGPRAALVNPSACGAYTANATLTPWSMSEPEGAVSATDAFKIASGCGLGFSPRFVAGTTGNLAGHSSAFVLSVGRHDGEGALGSIAAKLPPGLEAAIARVPLCGQAEAAAGDCPAASQIGHVTVQAGAGPYPVQLGGRVYLTGPYAGAPFGLSVVVPAVAGPFDLGNVVVRARVEIDRHTGQITVASDPLPQVIDSEGLSGAPDGGAPGGTLGATGSGLPIHLRALQISIDRDGLTLNPTNCNPMAVRGTIAPAPSASIAGGQAVAVSSRFQATGCERLSFHPSFSALTHARHTRRGGAYLHVVLRSGLGQSAIRSVRTQLPRVLAARGTTLKLACPATLFESNPASCPTGSVAGTARVQTPLLPIPLAGPVYLVSFGGAKFPDLVAVLQGDGVRVDLTGATSIAANGISGASFTRLPDVPLTRFDLILPQGPHSLLTASGSLCTHRKLRVTTTAQDGASQSRAIPLRSTGC